MGNGLLSIRLMVLVLDIASIVCSHGACCLWPLASLEAPVS